MTLSSVAAQVMWNRLISIVEEQAQALVRTAFSTPAQSCASATPQLAEELLGLTT